MLQFQVGRRPCSSRDFNRSEDAPASIATRLPVAQPQPESECLTRRIRDLDADSIIARPFGDRLPQRESPSLFSSDQHMETDVRLAGSLQIGRERPSIGAYRIIRTKEVGTGR